MSNAEEVLGQLSRDCPGIHEHDPLLNGPEGLCRAICRGLAGQIERQRQPVRHLLSEEAHTVAGERPAEEEDDWILDLQDAWDDVSGKALNPKKVQEARQLEMDYINGKKVWRKTTRKKALDQGYRIVGTRWIDIDKGDESRPEYRSRLVGKEYNTGPEQGLFASTPPLEALRWLVSEAATVEGLREKSWKGTSSRNGWASRNEDKIMLISDVSRAFFEAPMRRKV